MRWLYHLTLASSPTGEERSGFSMLYDRRFSNKRRKALRAAAGIATC